MKINVALSPDSFRLTNGEGKCVVVVDVLRASTTLVTALANGAERIIPFAAVEDARKRARTYSRDQILLCGERGSIRLPGFDLGNSPGEYEASVVGGKVLLFTSTNGSQMLNKATGAEEVLIAGLVNMRAVINHLVKYQRDCIIACSGHEGGFSLEDGVCAGMIVAGVKACSSGDSVQGSDETLTAEILYRYFSKDLQRMIAESFWGKYLTEIGLGDDLALCGEVDAFDLVPLLHDGALVREKV